MQTMGIIMVGKSILATGGTHVQAKLLFFAAQTPDTHSSGNPGHAHPMKDCTAAHPAGADTELSL